MMGSFFADIPDGQYTNAAEAGADGAKPLMLSRLPSSPVPIVRSHLTSSSCNTFSSPHLLHPPLLLQLSPHLPTPHAGSIMRSCHRCRCSSLSTATTCVLFPAPSYRPTRSRPAIPPPSPIARFDFQFSTGTHTSHPELHHLTLSCSRCRATSRPLDAVRVHHPDRTIPTSCSTARLPTLLHTLTSPQPRQHYQSTLPARSLFPLRAHTVTPVIPLICFEHPFRIPHVLPPALFIPSAVHLRAPATLRTPVPTTIFVVPATSQRFCPLVIPRIRPPDRTLLLRFD